MCFCAKRERDLIMTVQKGTMTSRQALTSRASLTEGVTLHVITTHWGWFCIDIRLSSISWYLHRTDICLLIYQLVLAAAPLARSSPKANTRSNEVVTIDTKIDTNRQANRIPGHEYCSINRPCPVTTTRYFKRVSFRGGNTTSRFYVISHDRTEDS